MLNHIEGVSEADSFPRQGGNQRSHSLKNPKKLVDDYGDHEHKPKLHDPKGYETSGSKGKENMTNEDEEEDDLSEGAKLKRKKRDQEIDENLWIAKKVKAREREVTFIAQDSDKVFLLETTCTIATN
ncbi:unnamed protein product [Lactuca saligna]|uniref:Uncharacterized protein n=1 Tax=Lactuca saligna TaxID=75948 RepID=A0AA35VJT0_LACSI|nr:unnamed protein product [Lactuca saligna]